MQAEQRLAGRRAEAEPLLADMRAEERLAERRAYAAAEWRAAVEAARMAADPNEFKRTIISIGVFFSVGTALMLAIFLVPGMSFQMQVHCWETAAICFFGVVDFFWRHPVVWFPAMRRWYDRRNQKPNTEPYAGYSSMARNL